MPDTAILVPARLASTRFPEKLLHPVAGRELILRVADRIAGQVPELPLVFAVDDEKLRGLVTANGHRAVMTDPAHPSGTDRLAEANREVKARFVINVQADEPLVTRCQIESLAELIRQGCDMATLGSPFARVEDFMNPNQVKVVVDRQNRALYFSLSPIPYPRDAHASLGSDWFRKNRAYRHLGLYAYTAEFLEAFTQLPPGVLESIEKLEQLRALENGRSIAVGFTDEPSVGIDTLEDAEAYERSLVG